MTFLLDSDSIIFMLRGLKKRVNRRSARGDIAQVAQRIFERARRHSRRGNIVAVSAITVAELEFGAHCSVDYQTEISAVKRALTPFALLPFDSERCARFYGEIRQKLEVVGKPIGSLDTLIAAHALALNATVVTNNVSEFSRVPGLRLENWTL